MKANVFFRQIYSTQTFGISYKTWPILRMPNSKSVNTNLSFTQINVQIDFFGVLILMHPLDVLCEGVSGSVQMHPLDVLFEVASL